MPQIEILPNTGSAPTPGWVYVADTGYDPSKTALNPTSGKRSTRYTGAGGATGGGEQLTTRQERTRQIRLRELDNDISSKEVPVPPRKKEGSFLGRTTQNTRRILQSAKRFDNYLSDEEAEVRNAPSQRAATKTFVPDRAKLVSGLRASESPFQSTPAPISVNNSSSQITNIGQARLFDAIVKATTPDLPSAEELEALLSAPPLTYTAARAGPSNANAPPIRVFCDMCGYLGRIRCMLCGARVCGLDCKRDHEDRCNRFG